MTDAGFERLRRVEREYLAARAALSYAEREWASIRHRDEWSGRTLGQVAEALFRLEATYLIRLFAEFEAILRDYWPTVMTAPVPPRVETLVNRLGSRSRVPADVRTEVSAVQHYRNTLVHEGARRVPPRSFPEARRALNLFLRHL